MWRSSITRLITCCVSQQICNVKQLCFCKLVIREIKLATKWCGFDRGPKTNDVCVPRWRSSITEIAADTDSAKNCLSNLSGEVSVGFVIFIYIEIVCTDVSIASYASVSVSISSCTVAIVNKDNLLTYNTLGISLVTIRALADASIVQEDKRALALQASSGLWWRAFFTSGIASNTSLAISCISRGALWETFSTQEESS